MPEHLLWIISRGAGIAALLLSSGGVALGLMMSGRLAKSWAKDLRPLHEALSLATLAALILHAVALLGDTYLSPSLADITIPFVFAFEPFWTGMGIIAGWLLVVLGLSFYARARIGVQRWRVLHRFTAVAWVMAIGHSLGSGTDADRWWFLAACAVVVAPTLVLLARRLIPASAGPQEPLSRVTSRA
jgi:sulfoxide reductase heme-binding subunit YedZ